MGMHVSFYACQFLLDKQSPLALREVLQWNVKDNVQ